MCGRFGLARPERLDLRRFGVGELPAVPPRYNIAPGSEILVVREREGTRRAELLHWGLIPSWAKDPAIGDRMANARADTAHEKPAFRSAIRTRRCLIPADVFFEWQAVPGEKRKRPHAVQMRGGESFAMAGVWEFWRPRDDPGHPGIASCAILTTDANELMRQVHHRMPVIVPPDRYRAWLDPRTPDPAIRDLLRPYPSDAMEAWPIGLRVNNPRADDASILAPLATGADAEHDDAGRAGR